MTNGVSDVVIKNIKMLYEKNEDAKNLFERLAGRSQARKALTLDRLAYLLGLSRGEAVAFARLLEENGCGDFKMGRRGQKSRFIWAFNPISLGKAAAGEDEELQEIDDVEDIDSDVEEVGDVEDVVAMSSQTSSLLASSKITISEARQMLAASLGVPINCVEITIRAA